MSRLLRNTPTDSQILKISDFWLFSLLISRILQVDPSKFKVSKRDNSISQQFQIISTATLVKLIYLALEASKFLFEVLNEFGVLKLRTFYLLGSCGNIDHALISAVSSMSSFILSHIVIAPPKIVCRLRICPLRQLRNRLVVSKFPNFGLFAKHICANLTIPAANNQKLAISGPVLVFRNSFNLNNIA